MASKAAYKRLMKEYAAIQQSPPPFINARPSEKNILEWHYVITGPPDSPYAGGEYHGKLIFPPDYPFKATETWNPSWSVASILTGLLSFMVEDESMLGSISTTIEDKRLFARQSHRWNRDKNPRFKELFPDLFNAAPPADIIPSSTLPTQDIVCGDTQDIGDDIVEKKRENDDIIMNDLKLLVSSTYARMFVGGLVFYLVYCVVIKQ